MEDPQYFSPGTLAVVKAIALVALPVVSAGLIWSGLRKLAPKGFFAVPLVYTLARLVGVGLGAILIYSLQDSRNFDLHEIFVSDGPWNISFAEFLLVRVNPFEYGPFAFIDKLAAARDASILAAVALAGSFCFALVWTWKVWRGRSAVRAMFCVIVIVLATAYLTIYGISLLFWLLFLFNSWTFLLLALLLNYYRGRH